MKRILSLLLAAVMLVSAVPTAFAADTNDHSQGTQVVYEAANQEAWTVTIPAALQPSQSGTVTLSGSWPSNKTISVTAEKTVTLTNSILATDQKVLDITFLGISKAGNDTAAKTYTETVSVAAIENALFGTWSGKFNYNVDVAGTPLVNTPLKFDVPYKFAAGQNVLGDSLIFHEDGSIEIDIGGTLQTIPAGTLTVNGNKIPIDEGFYAEISADGSKITLIDNEDAGAIYVLESALVHFTIDGIECIGEKGMNWEEWRFSLYEGPQFNFHVPMDETYVTGVMCGKLMTSSGVVVNYYDELIDGHAYITELKEHYPAN